MAIKYSRDEYVRQITQVAEKADAMKVHPREVFVIKQAVAQTQAGGVYKQKDPNLQLLDFQNYFRSLVNDHLQGWKASFPFQTLMWLLYPDMTNAVETKLCDIKSLVDYAKAKARAIENKTRVCFSGPTFKVS